ncbi:RNA ligase [Lactobacillus sp. AN1001]
MRKLFLMLGSPASGKSYFIKENNLQNYTIEADAVRRIVSNPATYIGDKGDYYKTDFNGIDFRDEKYVWEVIYSALERRMSQGETTIVDATHLFKGAFKKYDELRIKYNYQVYVVDMMSHLVDRLEEDELIDFLEANDAKRERCVWRDNIEKYVKRYKQRVENGFPNWLKVINKDGFLDELQGKVENFDCFSKIQIIGDVHGDMGALEKVFENHQRGTAYVFVGDYLDRGTKNQEVLDFIENLKGNNIFLLRGNHERTMERWINEDLRLGNFGSRTLPILLKNYESEDELRKNLKKLQKRLIDYLSFSFDGGRYVVTHAGIEPDLLKCYKNRGMLINEEDVVMGVSTKNGSPYEQDVDGKINLMKVTGDFQAQFDFPKQIHGHRNDYDWGTNQLFGTYNLTKDGKFRWITLTKGDKNVEAHEIDSIDGETFVSKVFSDENIKHVELEDGIIAHNFKRKVFDKGLWTDTTTHARGLFTKGDKIVGRGLKKFFYDGQTKESTLDNLEYPVRAYEKHNGFLAITFKDSDTGKIHIMSKGGGEKHSKIARDVIASDKSSNERYDTVMDELKALLNEYPNASVLFEIIEPDLDPHIVKYTKPQAIPIAIIENTEEGKVKPLSTAKNPVEFTAYTKQGLDSMLGQWLNDNPTTEGLVLYGANGLMIKEKTDFYNKAKELRKAMEKDGKIKYRYGAGTWYEKAKNLGEEEFTPDLALKLWNEDREIDKSTKYLGGTWGELAKVHLATVKLAQTDKKKVLALKDGVEIFKFDGSEEMVDKYSLMKIKTNQGCIAILDDMYISKGDYIITKNGKAIYLTESPILDVFELTETE